MSDRLALGQEKMSLLPLGHQDGVKIQPDLATGPPIYIYGVTRDQGPSGPNLDASKGILSILGFFQVPVAPIGKISSAFLLSHGFHWDRSTSAPIVQTWSKI